MRVIPAGALYLLLDSVGDSKSVGPIEMGGPIQKVLMHMEEIAYAHTLAARTLGKGLKAHLQDIAGVSRDSR